MNIVMAVRKAKSTYIQFRVGADVKRDFETVAELRGLSMSALFHSFAVKAIREEKEADPKAFTRIPKGQPLATTARKGILHKRETITKDKRKAQ